MNAHVRRAAAGALVIDVEVAASVGSHQIDKGQILLNSLTCHHLRAAVHDSGCLKALRQQRLVKGAGHAELLVSHGGREITDYRSLRLQRSLRLGDSDRVILDRLPVLRGHLADHGVLSHLEVRASIDDHLRLAVLGGRADRNLIHVAGHAGSVTRHIRGKCRCQLTRRNLQA